MATTWEFRLLAADPENARRAATETFREVDRLERLLSRFVEGSDVWCLNRLPRGEHRRIGDETAACLARAVELQAITDGAFHPGLGSVMDIVRGENTAQDWRATLAAAEDGCLAIDDEHGVVACLEPGFQLDLGAIGKGFTLDFITHMLAEWEIDSALLSAGGSSLLAWGREPWNVRLLGDAIRPDVTLKNIAIGSSGLSVQGDHIVDARRQTRETQHRRAWAFCARAADADALSTAAMVMSADEITAAQQRLDEPSVIVLETVAEGRLAKRIHAQPAGFATALGLTE